MGKGLPHRARFRAREAIIIALSLAAPICHSLTAESAALVDLQSTIQSIYNDRQDAIVRVKVATESRTESQDPQVKLLVLSGFFISESGDGGKNESERESERGCRSQDSLLDHRVVPSRVLGIYLANPSMALSLPWPLRSASRR